MLVFFALLFPLALPAAEQYNKEFSFELRDVTVKDVFRYIEKNSDYVFLYASDKNLSKRVSVDVRDKNVSEILDEVLAHTGLVYEIDGKQVIVKEASPNVANQSQAVQQKGKTLTGLLTDADGNPVIGATVVVKGTTNGVTTDIDGRYILKGLKDGDIIQYSFIGFNVEERVYKGEPSINIRMMETSVGLEDVVVIGYGQQKKSGVVSSVNSVTAKEIKAPVRNLTNNLAGQLAGVIAIQRNGEPGNDNAEFWIRGTSSFAGGTSPLVLVDGAPRAMQDIEPDEIESFTVLKDAAATAVYGAEGANGVVLITSKRGKAEKPRISFRGELSMATPTRLPEMLGSVDFMNLYNEALKNDGKAEYFSEDLIAKYASGEDPDLYPSTNWYDMLKKHTYNQRYTINVRGGSERARYFVSGAYYHETGIFKNNKMEDYDTNIGVSRYNLRSNIDIDITKSTLLSVDLSGQYLQKNNPGQSSDNIFTKMSYNPPYLIPFVYSDGTVAGHPSPTGNKVNPYNLLMNSGYSKTWQTSIQSTVKLEQKLDFLTKGLSWTGRISFDSYMNYNATRYKTPNQYYATGRDENGNLIYKQVVQGDDYLKEPEESSSGNKKIYVETSLKYHRVFAGKHDVNALLLYMQKEQQDHNQALAYRKQSMVGRLSYSFDERYFVEGSFGYTGSETFSPQHRFGFFPAVGVAYLLSNESFISDGFRDVVNKLKFRFSIGRTGNDNTGGDRFLYREKLGSGDGYNIGIGANGGLNGIGNSIIEGRFAAPTLGWEIENKRNVGLDLGLFNNKIDIQVDYFDNLRTDILLRRATIPTMTGFQQNPWQNYGKVSNRGIDGSIILNEKFGNWNLTFRGNVTFARNKILECDEIPQAHPWLNRTGTRLHSWFIYLADGLYTHNDFIITENPNGTKEYQLKPELPKNTLGVVYPGDIKLIDMNGDGVINNLDMVQDVGDPKIPELVYGFGLNVSYKGLYASVFFQGVGKTSVVLNAVNSQGIIPFTFGVEHTNLRREVLNRWTEENPSQNVLFPRLHSDKHQLSRTASTFWMRDGSFLRLKNIELGYNIPKAFAKKIWLQAARIYLMGYNVAVWDKVKMWDPEIGNKNAGMSYPLPRTFTLGVELTF